MSAEAEPIASSPTAKNVVWIAVCRLDELVPCKPKLIEFSGKSIGIILDGEKVHALLNFCPHAGAPICMNGKVSGYVSQESGGSLNYDANRKVIRCPWHHWEFDLETGKPIVESRGKLKKFNVRVQSGHVELGG